jgi:uncharacterized protein YciI
MLHLLLLEYTASERGAEPHVADHVDFLERHHREGTFVVSGQTLPSAHGGAIVVRGIDRATAERIAASDPFARAGVARYTVTTIDPGRVHPALASLLDVDDARVRG